MESLITGMLLIRQACFHGPHVFMSYSDWFQVTDIVVIQGTGHQLKNNIMSTAYIFLRHYSNNNVKHS